MYKTTIDFLKDEYWYGGVVHLGRLVPLSESDDEEFDLISGKDACDQYSPLFISSKGRYIYSEKPFVIRFKNGVISIEAIAEVTLSDGFETLKGAALAAAKAHFNLCGKIPDKDFFRVPQYNTWIELKYNQNEKDILNYAQTLVNEGMKSGILMIDEGWAPDYGDFDFCKRKFDDPKGMVEKLHKMGFRVMLWVTPHISPDSDCFRELRETDFLVHDSEGKIAIREWWNGYSCILDLSNPNACKWFKDKLDGVMEKYGVDGFKFDAGGAYLYRDDDKTAVVQEACEHTLSFDRFCAEYRYNELRSVWNCGGEPIVCRLQDKIPTWEVKDGLGTLMPNMLLQGLLGYYYGCPDMVGGGAYSYFNDDGSGLDEELYVRWLEASILCPMVQFSISPKRVLSPENFKKVMTLVGLRERYAERIMELAENASRMGEPIMRYMEYEFPNEGMERITDQFMLGSDMLVAPVIKKGATKKSVVLPKGKWKLGDKVFNDGCTVEVDAPLGTLPVFERV